MSGILSTGDRGIKQLQFDLGNHVIEKIRVVRRPLPNMVQKLGKLIIPTQNENPDKYFHLYTEIAAVNDKGEREVFAFEKNERINVLRKLSGGIPEPNEGMNIELKGKRITVNEYINNGRIAHNRAGIPYEKYRLNCSNCQRFTHLHLRGSGLEGGNEDVINFTIQPVSELLPKWSQRIANFITDAARLAGEGLDKLRF